MARQTGVSHIEGLGTISINGFSTFIINSITVSEDTAIEVKPALYSEYLQKGGLSNKEIQIDLAITDQTTSQVSQMRNLISNSLEQLVEFQIMHVYNGTVNSETEVYTGCVATSYNKTMDSSSGSSIQFTVKFKKATYSIS